MTKIEEIASKHLGKAGDGSVVKPYVTPDNIDNTLLVGVPRYLNRTHYDIDENNLPFVGYDTWNCYEFSTLTTSGFPVCGVIRLVYPANTPNIVESKSLKLYMNSFNMARLTKNPADVIQMAVNTIQRDVASALGLNDITKLKVAFCNEKTGTIHPLAVTKFIQIESNINVEKTNFDFFNEEPSILNIIESAPEPYNVYFWRSSVLRSNCRVTNQPDWGDVFVYMKGAKSVTAESFLQYIVSMRKENHFHEEICECIYKRLYDIIKPEELLVACLYTRRGGIDINPIRSTDEYLIEKYASGLINEKVNNFKTVRQ